MERCPFPRMDPEPLSTAKSLSSGNSHTKNHFHPFRHLAIDTYEHKPQPNLNHGYPRRLKTGLTWHPTTITSKPAPFNSEIWSFRSSSVNPGINLANRITSRTISLKRCWNFCQQLLPSDASLPDAESSTCNTWIYSLLPLPSHLNSLFVLNLVFASSFFLLLLLYRDGVYRLLIGCEQ